MVHVSLSAIVTVSRLQFPVVNCLIAGVFLLGGGQVHAQLGNTAQTAEIVTPSKTAMVQSLTTLFQSLQKRDFETAKQYVVLPEIFKPEMFDEFVKRSPPMLDGMISRQEFSLAGVTCLENEAKFGTAAEVFGTERAKFFAGKAGREVSECFGFNHETSTGTGEVIAHWNGKLFKLVRLDDVGKISPSAKP